MSFCSWYMVRMPVRQYSLSKWIWCRIQINSYVPLISCIYHHGLWLTTTNLLSVNLRVPFGTGNPGARAWDVRVPPSFLPRLDDDVSHDDQIASVKLESVRRTLTLPEDLIIPTWFHVTFPWKLLKQFCDEELYFINLVWRTVIPGKNPFPIASMTWGLLAKNIETL